jgi:hypothetical protein
MYCPSCGVESATGLSFCNRCGANLNTTMTTTQVIHTGGLAIPTTMIGLSVISLTLGGFALLIKGAVLLATVLQGNDAILAVVMFGILTILIADIMLIRLLSRLIMARLQTGHPAQPIQLVGNEPAKQIHARAPDYTSSVTEHTTRTLSEVKR